MKMKRKIWLRASILILAILMVSLLSHPRAGWSEDMLLVYSGAGLRKPMDKIGAAFEKKYGVSVKYNYASSNTLLSQIGLTKKFRPE